MRAPSAAFKSAITNYRQRLITNPNPVHVRNRWRSEFTMKVLDRWERHPNAETIWTEILTVIDSKCSAGEFIAAVALYRRQAEELTKIKKEIPNVEGKTRTDAKRYALNFQDGDRLINEVTEFSEFQRLRKRILGREKTAPRTRFMANLRASFEQLCGKPHDRLVASLTNVLFDHGADEAVTGESVRTAARRMKGQ